MKAIHGVIITVICLLALCATFAFGQSQEFSDPSVKHQWVCENKTKVAIWIIHVKLSGTSEEDLLHNNPFPEGWSDEIKIEATKLVYDAYASKETPQVFTKKYYDACIKDAK